MGCVPQLLCCHARQLIRKEMFGMAAWEGSSKAGVWVVHLPLLKERRERIAPLCYESTASKV